MLETTDNPVPDVGTGGNSLSDEGQDQNVLDFPADAGTDTSTSTDSENVSIPVREHRSLKTLQSEHDKLLNQLGPLKDTLSQYKGTDLLSMLQQYNEISGDPVLSGLIQQRLQTGAVTLPTQVSDDPYADEHMVQLQKRLENLESQVTGVRGDVQGLTQDQGMSKVKSYTERFLANYPLSEDQRDAYQRGMDQKLEVLGATPDGIRQLKNMSWETYRMLSVDVIEPFRGDVESRRLQATSRQRQEFATDAGPGVGTHGVQTQANLKLPKNQNDLVRQAQQVMREAMQRTARSGT